MRNLKFLNGFSKSRNRDFCFIKNVEGGTCFFQEGISEWGEYLRGVVTMEDTMFLWFNNFIKIRKKYQLHNSTLERQRGFETLEGF